MRIARQRKLSVDTFRERYALRVADRWGSHTWTGRRNGLAVRGIAMYMKACMARQAQLDKEGDEPEEVMPHMEEQKREEGKPDEMMSTDDDDTATEDDDDEDTDGDNDDDGSS